MSATMRPVMSWRKAISLSDLQPTTRLVALTLSMHMNEAGGSCFPSQTTLAAETGLSRSTVNAHLRILLDAGFINMAHRRRTGDGRQSSNEYQAAIPAHLIEVVEGKSRGGTNTKWLIPRVREDDTDPRDGGTLTRADAGHQEDALEDAIEDAPPTPPDGGNTDGEPGTLFDDEPGPQPPKRKRRSNTPCPRFDAWWTQWPNKVDRKQARRAWGALMAEGVDPDRLDLALLNYQAAIQTHATATGLPPSIMHGATFLRGRWERYETNPSPDPAWPKGRATSSGQAATPEARELARALAALPEGAPQ